MSDTNQPEFKILEEAYGFDDVAIVPGDVTVNPDMTQTDIKIRSISQLWLPQWMRSYHRVSLLRCIQ